MKRTFFVFVVLFGGTTIAVAQDCAQTVMKSLYAELEAIDVDGEHRLAQAIEALSSQESWSSDQRQDFTLSIAENPEVDAAEKNVRKFWRTCLVSCSVASTTASKSTSLETTP